MNEISFKELKIEHQVKTKLKNSYISVKNNSTILLKTPKVSHSFILELLNEKESWIRKQLLKIDDKIKHEISWQDEVLLYGEVYSIDSQEASELRMILKNINTSNSKKLREAYADFYLHSSQEYLTSRVEYFALQMQLKYSEIKFKKLKSRWGSCSSLRVITLNTLLMQLPKELSDYVVVHELAHLVHMNHSKEFHLLVDRYIQDSKNIRKKLKNREIYNFS